MSKVRVEYKKAKNRALPAIVSFPHNPPPAHFLNSSDDKCLKFQILENTDSSLSWQRVLTAENNDVSYKAQNFGKNSVKNSSSRYLLGLYDPDESNIEFFDVEGIFNVDQTMKHDRQSQPITTDGNTEDLRDQLIETFGTKKSKQRMRTSKNAAMDDKEIATPMKMINSIIEKTASMEPMDEDILDRDFLPPHNLETTKLEEIYPISGIIPSSIASEISTKKVEKVLQKPKRVVRLRNFWESYTVSLLESIPQHDTDKLKQLVFLNGMIRIYKLSPVLHLKQEKYDEILKTTTEQDELLGYLLNTFYQSTQKEPYEKYVRNKANTDKLICHICILNLILQGFKMKISELAGCLKMSPKKLVTYFRSVGARVTNDEATLVGPLSFPKIQRMKKR